MYSYLFTVYLPSRYPSIFKLSTGQNGSIISLENLVTKETIPTNPENLSLRTALESISRNIDEDFFILLPHKSDDDVVYVLEAYSACFPSGFQPREKLGKRLADIHGPVPGYKVKLQKSMDRFFARLETGKLVRRVNWSLTVDEELFSNFDKSKPAFEGTLKKLAMEDLDLEKVCSSVTPLICRLSNLFLSDIPPLRTTDSSSSAEIWRNRLCFPHLPLPHRRCQGGWKWRGSRDGH